MSRSNYPAAFHGGLNHPEMIKSQFFLCPLCKNELVTPKIMNNCGHVTCARCLAAATFPYTQGNFPGSETVAPCPVCGTYSTYPPDGAKNAHDAVGLSRQIDFMLRRHNKAQNASPGYYNIPTERYTEVPSHTLTAFGTCDGWCGKPTSCHTKVQGCGQPPTDPSAAGSNDATLKCQDTIPAEGEGHSPREGFSCPCRLK